MKSKILYQFMLFIYIGTFVPLYTGSSTTQPSNTVFAVGKQRIGEMHRSVKKFIKKVRGFENQNAIRISIISLLTMVGVGGALHKTGWLFGKARPIDETKTRDESTSNVPPANGSSDIDKKNAETKKEDGQLIAHEILNKILDKVDRERLEKYAKVAALVTNGTSETSDEDADREMKTMVQESSEQSKVLDNLTENGIEKIEAPSNGVHLIQEESASESIATKENETAEDQREQEVPGKEEVKEDGKIVAHEVINSILNEIDRINSEKHKKISDVVRVTNGNSEMSGNMKEDADTKKKTRLQKSSGENSKPTDVKKEKTKNAKRKTPCSYSRSTITPSTQSMQSSIQKQVSAVQQSSAFKKNIVKVEQASPQEKQKAIQDLLEAERTVEDPSFVAKALNVLFKGITGEGEAWAMMLETTEPNDPVNARTVQHLIQSLRRQYIIGRSDETGMFLVEK